MVLRNVGIPPYHYTVSNLQDHDMHFHRRENLESRIFLLRFSPTPNKFRLDGSVILARYSLDHTERVKKGQVQGRKLSHDDIVNMYSLMR